MGQWYDQIEDKIETHILKRCAKVLNIKCVGDVAALSYCMIG